MTKKDKPHIDFGAVDLDKVDTSKLSAEEYLRLLELKGLIKEGNYTEERRKGLDNISQEELESKIRATSRQVKEKGISSFKK